jgi:DNA-binding HxlR family transcriptional regulator
LGLGYLESSILVAVSRGINTLGELSGLFRGVDPKVLEASLRSLEASGYLRSELRGFIFKKRVYTLTEKGARALDEAARNVEKASIEARRLAREGRRVDEWPVELAWILPLLLWLGLIDLALVSSIGYAEEYYGDVEGGPEAEAGGEGFDVDFGDVGGEF